MALPWPSPSQRRLAVILLAVTFLQVFTRFLDIKLSVPGKEASIKPTLRVKNASIDTMKSVPSKDAMNPSKVASNDEMKASKADSNVPSNDTSEPRKVSSNDAMKAAQVVSNDVPKPAQVISSDLPKPDKASSNDATEFAEAPSNATTKPAEVPAKPAEVPATDASKPAEVLANDEIKPAKIVSNEATKPPQIPSNSAVLPDKIFSNATADNKELPSQPQAVPYNAYWCGWDGDVTGEIVKVLFDDALNIDPKAPPESFLLNQAVLDNHTSNDVAFVTLEGPCVVDHRARAVELPKKFKGRILYWNGESRPMYRLDVRDRVYALSHEPGDGDKRRMRMHYGVTIVASLPYEVQRTLYYPEYRAKNTGERFLIYANGNCVK